MYSVCAFYISNMKTNKTLLILSLTALFLCLFSCKNGINGKSSDKDSTKIDTLWNETVQNTFYNTQFGSSQEQAIKNFTKHGFKLDNKISEKNFLDFYMPNKKGFIFEGTNWQDVQLKFIDGKFKEIRFLKCFNNPSKAVTTFKSLVDILSKKYKITNLYAFESEERYHRTVFGKTKINAEFSYFGIEASGGYVRFDSDNTISSRDYGETAYGVSLSFIDNNRYDKSK